jgi:hypothetical protein
MKRAISVVVFLMLAFSFADQASAQAPEGVTVYTDRTTFSSANPGLVTEDFETNQTTRTIANFPGPLDSTSGGSDDSGTVFFAQSQARLKSETTRRR